MGTVPKGLSDYDGCARVGCGADRSLRDISVVPRGTSAGNGRPFDVSSTFTDVQICYEWLALDWDGVEGACRVVCSDLDHDGRLCLHQLRSRTQTPSTASCCGSLFCRCLVFCCRNRRFLWRDDKQVRSSPRWSNDSAETGRGKMTTSGKIPSLTPTLTNGSGAAAILSAGIGSFTLAVLAIASDKSAPIKNILIFYKPTGPLSGVTTTAILIWLLTWVILEWRWRDRTV